MPRTIAIGDIHGCSDALVSVLLAIDPKPDDTIITLGDYVDRGMDSKGVLDMLIELSKRCLLIPILGNHDEMMLRARASKSAFRDWWEWGAIETLDSYGDSGRIELIPDGHFKFLESSVPWFESKAHFFVHANYDPDLPLDQQDERMLRWLSLRDYVPGPHALAGGRTLPEVRDAAGHANISTTSIYLHAVHDDDEQVGSLFDFRPAGMGTKK
jgi:serine/threonine protein phosphatase 1